MQLSLIIKMLASYQRHDLTRIFALAFIYALLAKLVLGFSSANGNVTIFWIPGGLSVASLLLWGNRYWPGVFIGALAAGLLVKDPLILSIAIATGNTLESVTAATLLRRNAKFDLALVNLNAFLLIAEVGAVSSLISSVIGPLSLLGFHYLTADTLVKAMLHWWQADFLGIVFGVPIVLMVKHWPATAIKRYPIQAALLFSLAFLTGQIVFLDWFHQSLGQYSKGYWLFPFIIWAARQFGGIGALLIIIMTTIQTLLGASLGVGFFSNDIAYTGLQNLWAYLLILTSTGISLAISIDQLKRTKHQLQQKEAHLQAFFDFSPIGINVFDAEGKALAVNRAARQMFGVALDDPLTDYRLFNDPAILDSTKQALRQGQIAQESRYIDFQQIAEHGMYQSSRATNEPLFISLTLTPCYSYTQSNQQINGYIASIVDMSEQKLRELEVQRINQAYQVLLEFNQLARKITTEAELFSEVCRIAVEAGNMKMAWIGKKHPDTEQIILITCFGENTDYLNNIDISVNPNIPAGQGPTGTAMREGRTVLCQNFVESDSTRLWVTSSQRTGNWASSAAFPVFRGTDIQLVFTMYHNETNAFNQTIVNLYEILSMDIGFTLSMLDIEMERRQAEETLAREERRIRAILETTSECVKLVSPNGTLLSMNAAGLALVEAEQIDDVLNQSIYRFLAPEYRDAFAQFNAAVCAGNPGSLSFEIIGLKGSRRWMESHAVPFHLETENQIVQLAFTQDITIRKQAESSLRLTHQVFECTLEGIIITDADKNIIEVNQAFSRITGYDREEMLGRNPRFLKSGHQKPAFYAEMWQTIHQTGHWNGEMWNRRKDGEVYPEWISISAITDDFGTVSHYVGISSDITLLKQHEKQLEHIAHYDALTGIPNRVLLVDRMQQALAQTRREQKLLAICYLDLDGFKPINDTEGHEAGDKVLIKIAERISHGLRGGDTIARLGGDEFAILLLGMEDLNDCRTSLDRLLRIIDQPILLGNQSFQVTASIGVTLYPLDDEAPDILLRHADQAMYLAKQAGKNRFHFFDSDQDTQIKTTRELRKAIEQGLAAGEFKLFYQPKIALADYQLVGAEALIRWQHPELGLLSPAQFLPSIENSDLEITVGEWVIQTALKQLTEWHLQGLDMEVSINISAAHLQSPRFIDVLSHLLSAHPELPAQCLQIEILETAALADITNVSKIINDCAQLGIRFALDDFGTGYSSLAYLRGLPADTLKIDQSFVKSMLTNVGDRAIVQGIIALAETFNRTTVAEGVETNEHLCCLAELGCNIAQGYGIARPMPADQLISWQQTVLIKLPDNLHTANSPEQYGN